MSAASTDERLRRLRRSAARAERRLRYRTALARVALWLPLPLAVAAGALAAVKALRLDADAQKVLLYATLAALLVAVGAILPAWLRRPPRWAGALALDQHHRLDDRATNALELAEVPVEQRSDFAAAAIEDGLRAADRLDPRRAVPIPVPRELLVSAALVALLAGIAWFEVRVARPVPAPVPFEPLVLAADDLSLFGDIGQKLAEKAQDPESLVAIRRFNALIEDIADRRLDRKEAFEKLGELESALAAKADADREARELGLSDVARELMRSGLTKNAAEALEDKRLADAEKALRELAERLKRKEQAPSAAELEKLRKAMQRASEVSGERLRAVEQRRRELEEEKKSLLKKQKDQKEQKSAQGEAKLQDNARKLERLDREKEKAERAAKELSQLDRELAEAAKDLMKHRGKSAEDIQQSADDLNRMAKREMSDQEKRELLERMRELREVLRQQGQGGSQRLRQMTRFGQRARGGQQPGQGQGQQKTQGKGQGKRQGSGAPGVEVVQVPSLRTVPGPATQSGQGADGEPGSGQESASGREWGKGHDPKLQGEATAPTGQTQDVTAAGVDSGQGTASAEVIYGAAERGFVGRGYRDVYDQYEPVAEQALNHDQIPSGYRFYVRRYFQLIRPRQ